MSKLYRAKSTISGHGLYTNQPFKKGQTVAFIHGPVAVIRVFTKKISKETGNWIGVGRFSWINTDESMFRFINHSCEPNVALISKRKVVALKDIPPDTEITMDYSLTEAQPDWLLKNCKCGSKHCRVDIGPIQSLPNSVFIAKKKLIPKKFIKVYNVEKRKS